MESEMETMSSCKTMIIAFDDTEAGLLIENEDVKANASDEDIYNEDAHGSYLCAV